MKVIDGELSLDFIFNKAEALAETLYVVESDEEDVLPTKKKKRAGKRGIQCAECYLGTMFDYLWKKLL